MRIKDPEQAAELFGVDPRTMSEHLPNIYCCRSNALANPESSARAESRHWATGDRVYMVSEHAG